MAITISDVERQLEANGFQRGNGTNKAVEFKSNRNGKILYFRPERGLPNYIRLAMHPTDDITSLLAISGVEANKNEVEHGSNMLRFPKKKYKGKKDIHFGKALNIFSLEALAAFSVAFHSL